MGWFNSSYIKKFCAGKTIQSIKEVHHGYAVEIHFTDGTYIRIFFDLRCQGSSVTVKPTKGGTTIEVKTEVVVTPFGADGEVVQSVNI